MKQPTLTTPKFIPLPVQQWQADAGAGASASDGGAGGDATSPTEGDGDGKGGTESKPDANAKPAGEEGGATGREAGAAPPSDGTDGDAEGGKPTGQQEPWFVKRLARKTAELAESRAEVERLTRAAATPRTGETDAQFDARVQAEVTKRLAEAKAQGQDAEFASALKAAVATGEKTYGKDEFTRAATSLGRLCDNTSPAERQRYISFLQTMNDTGEMPKLISMLGQDLEEAERIMGLSPGKQGVELAKLASKDAPEASRTPRPPRTTVGARGAAMADIKASDPERSGELSTAEWMKRREAEVKAQREART